MKHFVISFILCLVTVIGVNAQQTITITNGNISISSGGKTAREVLDSAYLKCSYNLKFIKDVDKPENGSEEEMLLLVGNKITQFYSYSRFYADSLIQSMTPEQLMNNIGRVKGGEFSYQLYKHYPEGQITTTDKIANSTYKYEESLGNINWEIYPDTMTILGYVCQKAGASFHGRNYTAWFTTAIPVSEGPWKFSGLPGLMLNIADTEHHYVFECTGIETPKEKIPITMQKLTYTNVSKKEFNKVLERYLKDPVGFVTNELATSGVMTNIKFSSPDGSPLNKNDIPKTPYNPIELIP